MKNFLFYKTTILTTILTVLSISLSNSQTTDFIEILSNPDEEYVSLALDGNNLYAIAESLSSNTKKIIKIDITQTNPTPELVLDITGSYSLEQRQMAINGNYLYFSTLSWIRRIDLTQTNPVPETVHSENAGGSYGFHVRSLNFYGDELYVLYDRFENFNSFNIWGYFKLDTSVPNPTPVLINNFSSGLDQRDFSIVGDDLYYSIGGVAFLKYNLISAAVSGISTSGEIVISDLNERFLVDGTTVYKSAFDIDTFDFTDPNNITSMRLNNNPLSQPARDIVFDGDCLYVSYEGGISNLCLSALSVDEFEPQKIVLYPSPAKETFTISGITETKAYTIYDITGREVLNGRVAADENIDVSKLKTGIYFIKLSNKFIKKFSKQ